MTEDKPEQVDTHFLTAMQNTKETDGHQWQSGDLASLWKHQLNAPLGHDLSKTSPDAEETIIRLRKEIREAPVTFGGLFRHPNPPYELLSLVKEFAKKQGTREDRLLPKETCSALYYISIYLAGKHHKQRITDLDDATVQKGVEWLRHQEWLDLETKEIL